MGGFGGVFELGSAIAMEVILCFSCAMRDTWWNRKVIYVADVKYCIQMVALLPNLREVSNWDRKRGLGELQKKKKKKSLGMKELFQE